MSFAFGQPSCGCALHCVGVLKLWTCTDVPCIVHCIADVRWGAHLENVPCVALGRPTCGHVPHVAFGRPSSGRVLHYVGAPNLGEAVLKSLPPSQNLFLSILQLVF
jgi:hypothetical protein